MCKHCPRGMAVTYRLRKPAVPYKTRLTGRLISLRMRGSAQPRRTPRQLRIWREDSMGQWVPRPPPFALPVPYLGGNARPMADLSVGGNRLEPPIALYPSRAGTRRCSDCDRRLRGLARGRDQPVKRKRAGFKRSKRATLQNRLRLHQRWTHHRFVHRTVRLEPARRSAATRSTTAGRTRGCVHANPAGPARDDARRKAESPARHRNRGKTAGAACKFNRSNPAGSACTRHRPGRATAAATTGPG